jgi:colanic acid/amylovoran biosynthesis glycosyltransferase
MRVAYLVNQYPKTSHTFIRREIQALERAGVEVMRISLRGWDGELVDDDDVIERKKTRYVLKAGSPTLIFSALRKIFTRPVHFVRGLLLALRMGWRAERPLPVHIIYLLEACLIQEWLELQKIQHLHAHFGTNSAEVAMLVHVLGGPSWSFTVHGPEEFDKPRFIGLAEKVRRSSFVVAISSYGRSQLFRLVEPRYWSKIQVVRCGLERAFFETPSKTKPSIPRFICVGRLCEQKGQLLLLKAAARLKSNGANFELVLAGDGEMRKDVEEFILNERLGSTVRITGWIDGSQVRKEILDATALVLPSLAEGLPVVIMEAMALRTPIISTYVGGIPELVSNGAHGWLVPAGDVEALVQAMQVCLDYPDEALREMGHSARKSALCFHNVENEAKKIWRLFEGSIKASVSERG